jgi:hypothetical protein
MRSRLNTRGLRQSVATYTVSDRDDLTLQESKFQIWAGESHTHEGKIRLHYSFLSTSVLRLLRFRTVGRKMKCAMLTSCSSLHVVHDTAMRRES